MNEPTFSIHPIGVIHSPHSRSEGTPVQPPMARGVRGWLDVRPEYAQALEDLDRFDRIWLLYWFDRAKPYQARVTPYLDNRERGLFATRAPCRPNPIGLSHVRLERIEGLVVHVSGIDAPTRPSSPDWRKISSRSRCPKRCVACSHSTRTPYPESTWPRSST